MAILASVLAVSGYVSKEIALPLENSYIIEAHVGNDELVAGYAVDFIMFDPYLSNTALPFVWHKGKGHLLPTGAGEYGHVRAIGPDFVLGDVSDEEDDWVPAKWTADKEHGWSKATLSLLTKEGGIARQVDPDGTIWIESPKFVGQLKDGKLTKIPLESYDFERVDKRGRIFVNTHGSIGYHGTREDQRACYIQDGVKHLLVGDERFSKITSVTSDGVALVDGAFPSSENHQGIWRDGTLNPIESPLSRVNGITDDGRLYGYVQEGDRDSYPAMMVSGKFLDIRAAVPAIKVSGIDGMNSQGQITIRSGDPHDHERFYLLTPKR